MTETTRAAFIETKEYRRFREFCDACRRDRYIGLCNGPAGVGKTLSARQYAHWDMVQGYQAYRTGRGPLPAGLLSFDTVVYTTPVVTSPGQIESAITDLRGALRASHLAVIRQEEEPRLEAAEQRLEELRTAPRNRHVFVQQETDAVWAADQAVREIRTRLASRESAVKDPTALIVIDEADRLKMAGLEQVRDIFDRGGIGLVLIGMPGLERRLARYAQLYSRVGFVHEFRALGTGEVRTLLAGWRPPGVTLPEDLLADAEGVAAIIRVSGGNFRLLDRLLTQVARILALNGLSAVTGAVVEAAREVLVIGTS
jgi:DNA transposition AAA+ family ATPase